MVVPVETAFFIFGGIILIGYIGDLFAKKFAVPNVLLLLMIGYLLRLSGYIGAADLAGIQGIFGTLALVILLFDGGLSMNIYDVVFKSGRVLVNSLLTTVLGILGAALLFLLLGLNPLIGAILGAIAGGLGSTTTISMVKSLSIPAPIKNFLTLESSITDVFSIILALVLTQALISGAVDAQNIGQGIVTKFSVGLFIGLVAGIASLALLASIEKGYNYMLTFAMVLILYALTEFLAGSGAIAVLVFGVVFGNEGHIRRMFRLGHGEQHPIIREFQNEISFFIRTFFFVFLGVVVSLGGIENFAIGLAFTLLLYGVRYISVTISTKGSEIYNFIKVLTAVNPRGLATAVLATYPLIIVQGMLASGQNGGLDALLPQLNMLPEIAFYMIILSIIFTTAAVPLVLKGSVKKKESLDEMQAEAESSTEPEQQPGEGKEEAEELQPAENEK